MGFSNQQWVKDSKVSRKTNEDGITKFQIDRFSQQYSYEDIYIDNDIFRDFIIEFHQNFDIQQDQDTELYKKDITEKFINMKCNKSMVKQYDKLSLYFPVISQVMHSTTFMSTKNKLIISSVIIEAYNNNFDLYDTGHKILEAMVHEIFINYKNKIKYTETNLKLYIKVLCCWLIYECDIFDDKKE